ncbi:hypothetical protein AXF41_14995 [Clostridium haemolyticum]|nr:hypothetical protein AXF41_14995 [Clostridium haemolyticum]
MGIGSVFPGSGYNLPYFIASFIARWCGQIPLLYLVVRVIKLPIIGVWWVFAVADILEMIVVICFYIKRKVGK